MSEDLSLPTMEWVIELARQHNPDGEMLTAFNIFVAWCFGKIPTSESKMSYYPNISTEWRNLSIHDHEKWNQLALNHKNKVGKAFYKRLPNDVQEELRSTYIERQARPGGDIYNTAKNNFNDLRCVS